MEDCTIMMPTLAPVPAMQMRCRVSETKMMLTATWYFSKQDNLKHCVMMCSVVATWQMSLTMLSAT